MGTMNNGLDIVELGKKVSYVEVDYDELEWIVEAFYPDFFFEYPNPKWENCNICVENGWNNDTKESINIGSEYRDELEVEMFLNDPEEWAKEYLAYPSWDQSKYRPSYRSFLEDLWDLGIIEYDEFLVNISW